MDSASPIFDRQLRERAIAWRNTDIDDEDITALDALITEAEALDTVALKTLSHLFGEPLAFGTAGLRGPMGPGPGGMNTKTVCRAATALATYLLEKLPTGASHPPPLVVIGFDGRHRSASFARASAAVFISMGLRAEVSPHPIPTPVLAFAIRDRDAAAGVMVTASHNPARDNGYKVYLGDGRQIIAPVDEDIARLMETQAPMSTVTSPTSIGHLPKAVIDRYIMTAAAILTPNTPRELAIVHTALHGVSTAIFGQCLDAAGFRPAIEVPTQADPDPDFPTVAFPNPEESGAMDEALALAAREAADVVIAHDPDGDRCAVAITDGDRWRTLSGDEVGALIGWWLLQRRPEVTGAFAASLVSGSMLRTIATAHNVPYVTTLTGFKWITRVPDLAYGYEEALGYCVDPTHVADKDGLTAALLVCELAARERSAGRRISDVLDDLARDYGVHLSRQVAVRVDDAGSARVLAEQLCANPPRQVGNLSVQQVTNLGSGTDEFPPTPGVRLLLGDHATVFIRPSGTEPKVKAYLQVQFAPGPDVQERRIEGARLLDSLAVGIADAITRTLKA